MTKKRVLKEKNNIFGAFGDGGTIVTDDEEIAQAVRIFRNYGSEKRYYNKVVGANSRLDEM